MRGAIIRTFPVPLKEGYYNAQEMGLARALVKKGIDIDLFMASRCNKDESHEVLDQDGRTLTINELRLVKIPFLNQAYYPALITQLKNKHYDFIHINEENEITTYLVSKYAAKNSIPCVLYQGIYKPIPGRIFDLYRWVFNKYFLDRLQRNIRVAFAKTSRAKDYLESKGFENVRVVPVGLDISPFESSVPKRWDFIDNIKDDTTVLLYIGTLESRRNPDFLLEVAKHSKNTIMVIAGSGPMEQHVRDRMEEEHIDNVILLGNVPQKNIPSLYLVADFFLLPSDYEIYGMVVLESLYFGCPVLSTRTAGPSDLIQEGTNGELFERLDVDEWIDAIERLRGKLDRKSISRFISEQLTWDRVAQNYLSFINEIMV